VASTSRFQRSAQFWFLASGLVVLLVVIRKRHGESDDVCRTTTSSTDSLHDNPPRFARHAQAETSGALLDAARRFCSQSKHRTPQSPTSPERAGVGVVTSSALPRPKENYSSPSSEARNRSTRFEGRRRSACHRRFPAPAGGIHGDGTGCRSSTCAGARPLGDLRALGAFAS